MPSTPTFITTSGPAVEPITLEEMKTRLRVSGCDFDSELSDMLISARQQVEADTYRKLITQTVVMYQEDFVSLLGPLDIRLAPIQSITHVKYYDRDDALQTFAAADYYANLTSTPPEIRLKESKQWPNTSLYRPNKVEVTMVAGYGATAASVPRAAKLAMVEYCRAIWDGCDHNTDTYRRLVASLQWTGYHKVFA